MTSVAAKRRVPNLANGIRRTAGAVRRPVAPAQALLLARLAELLSARSWYLAETLPRQEALAVRILTDAGVAAYAPTETRWVRRARHAKARRAIETPALPGYVLVGLDSDRERFDALAIRPIRGVLGSGGVPRRLRVYPHDPERCAVRWIVERSDASAAVAGFIARERGYAEGSTVEFRSGPLRETRARVVEIGERAVRIMFAFLGGERELWADPDDIEGVTPLVTPAASVAA